MGKRKMPDSKTPSDSLTEHERLIYDVIRSKQGLGIWTPDIKRELKTNLPENVFTKSIKSLQDKNMIKNVVNIQKIGKKHFMAVEFEPSMEISGEAWYSNGNLDTEFIKVVKAQCVKQIIKLKVATLEGISDCIKRTGAITFDLTKEQIDEIVRALVLDNEIMEVTSNGSGEFTDIPAGKVCYKNISTRGSGGEPKTGSLCLASIPCGVCPQINICTPDGLISSKTCVYYTKWLDF